MPSPVHVHTPSSIQQLAHLLFHIGTCCLCCGLTVLGIMSMVAPAAAAELYGLPIQAETAWVRVAGLRDIGLAVAAAALYLYEPRALRAFCPTLLVIPIGDAALTLALGGTVMGALTHLGGTLAISILTAAAWLDPKLDATNAKWPKRGD